MSITQKTYNVIAADYQKRALEYSKIYLMRKLDLFSKYLKKLNDSEKLILDLGCAGGVECKWFVDQGYQVVGLDFSEELIKIAKNYCPDAEFILSDMLMAEFPENHFSGIWANASLLHLNDREFLTMLSKIYEWLKPDGIVQITLMVGNEKGYRKDVKKGWGDRYFNDFQIDDVKKIVTEKGFLWLEGWSDVGSSGRGFINMFWKKPSKN
jgi:SAM-dependent methyltransferase